MTANKRRRSGEALLRELSKGFTALRFASMNVRQVHVEAKISGKYFLATSVIAPVGKTKEKEPSAIRT